MLESVLLGVLLYFHPIRCQDTHFEARIVEGENSVISDFPYSVFLGASCVDFAWGCGGSILNQYIILTAAHCVYGCSVNKSSILAKCGDSNINKGREYLAAKYVSHPKYLEISTAFDVGLILMKKPLKFSRNVGRVAVMQTPPYNERCKLAGWGKVDEVRDINSPHLHHIFQTVTRRTPCERLIGPLPLGVICGGDFVSNNYAASGDSGSALVVRSYIQVGIVSFKRIDISRSLVVYSDVGYFFKWIKAAANLLHCIRPK